MNQWCSDVGILSPTLAFKRSIDTQANVDKGIGLFAIRSISAAKEDDVFASIPLHACLSHSVVEKLALAAPSETTQGSFVADTLGRCYKAVSDDIESCGGMDPRKAVMLFLIWHKFCYKPLFSNADASQVASTASTSLDPHNPSYWNAYIDVLPESLDTPVFYSPESEEMKLLTGTGIDVAVSSKLQKLYREYQALRPHLALLHPEERADAEDADNLSICSFERYKWADGVYWSRVLSFQSMNDNIEGDDCHLVPFLDFANHSNSPHLRWHVEKNSIQLRLTQTGAASDIPAGEELCISYGEKPNQELLFIHGFTLQDNPNDSIMFPAPILEKSHEDITPEDEFTIQNKIGLMKVLGLKPVVYLRPPHEGNDGEMEGELNFKRFGLDMDSLIVMLISVMTAPDGLAPIPRNISSTQQRASSDKRTYLVSNQAINSPESFMEMIRNHPMKDILLLRVFTILQSAIDERLIEMNQIEDFEEEQDSVFPKTRKEVATASQRELFVSVLREGHFKILVGGMQWLGELQMEYAERESVVAYLQSMQIEDE
ncbi:hypothetical protein HDV05_003347 [Chytridiales sp. JEL 0842]|nr:hypothetical protein HDV05_003347 [Chytridiales sp. JEL 0842]